MPPRGSGFTLHSAGDPVCRADMEVRALPPLPEDDLAMLRELFTYLTKPHPRACHKKARFGGLLARSFATRHMTQDGQKYVCLDPEFTLHTSRRCLVYSFGIATDWTFDWDMERFGCTVHAFDPSIDLASGSMNGTISFLRYGLGATDHRDEHGWQIRTLDTFVDFLGHRERVIHYLKMDVEVMEFEVLRQQVMRMRSSPLARNVEQIGVELHMTLFLPVWKHIDFYREMYKTFWVMQRMGYYPFYYESNPMIEADMDVPGLDEKLVSAMEVVWMKTRCVKPSA
ncbi:Methyltransferase-like protein 24 [Amphibalanus amphitrite]|uniref:Methyltransferase-like protein 24 n=1 Tax=Amphibalanus amphitrite TaxID=1232801 RepID=A0A6A4W4Y6_AMPAM|nr:Methyltransferase-like protein 24 [Amphibalanus amphitrite]